MTIWKRASAESVKPAYTAVPALLSAIAVLALSGLGKAAETSVKTKGSCQVLSGNRTLTLVLLKTKEADGFLRPRSDICEVLSRFRAVDQGDLVLTTMRVGKHYGVCIGKSSNAPCSALIADVEQGVAASEALQFAYGLDLQRGGPQRQTVERLFIKPSAIIR